MKTHAHLSILAGLSLAAHGQSLDSLAPPQNTELPSRPNQAEQETTPEVQPEPAVSESDPELINKTSRYASIDIDAYIRTVSSTFSMRKRDRDPFGRHQDPNFKPPVAKTPTRTIAKYTPPPVTPFSDIVEAIRITTIIPAEQQFLVDGRSFRTGDEIKLNTGNGDLLTIHVVSVRADRVTFRHGVTNETADHALRMLPGGMQRGGGDGIRPAGVSSPDEEAPIDISGSGAGNSLSSSR
jgi:hypothetical protein